jgi:hypothetical protein
MFNNSPYSRFGPSTGAFGSNGTFGSIGPLRANGLYNNGSNGLYGNGLYSNGFSNNGLYNNGWYPSGSFGTGSYTGNPYGFYTGNSNGFYAPNFPATAYQSVPNPGLAYATEYYSRFNPNYGNNFYGNNFGAYTNAEANQGYGGYSPYYGNNGGNGMNAASSGNYQPMNPSGNYAPTNYGTGYVPQNYGYGIQYPQTGAPVGDLGYPNSSGTGSYSATGVTPAAEGAPATGTYGWF